MTRFGAFRFGRFALVVACGWGYAWGRDFDVMSIGSASEEMSRIMPEGSSRGDTFIAGQTLIDFGAGDGCPGSGHVVLTNQLQAAYGVVFSTTDAEGVFWWGGDYPYPPARCSITAGDLGDGQFTEPIRVDFDKAVSQVSVR